MINISISTEVPDFFKSTFNSSKKKFCSFEEYFYSKIPKEIREEFDVLLKQILENYVRDGLTINIPIKGDYILFLDEIYTLEEGFCKKLKDYQKEGIKFVTGIDLVDGYYKDIETGKLASFSNFSSLSKKITESLKLEPLVKLLSSSDIIGDYGRELYQKNQVEELEIYNKWVIHNIQLIKSQI
jgi:hypothetical protein